jgi:AraC family transcriptional regulator
MAMASASGNVPVTLGSPSFHDLDLGPAMVTDAWFPARTVLPRHTHERASVVVMMEGSFDLELASATRHCGPTAVFSEPAGSAHTNRMGGAGAHVVVVQPDPMEAELFRPFAGVLQQPTHRYHGGLAARASQLARELHAVDDLGPLAAEGIVMEMLVALTRLGRPPHRVPPAWLWRAQELLHARFSETVRLADVAREVAVHPAHLARVFKGHFGISVGGYVRRLRLDWAAVELERSDTSLAGVALTAGFADQSHFTRVFRRHTGFTPSVYRRTRRGRRFA